MKPRALLVSHKHPLPPDDGKKAVLAGLLEYLVDRFGADAVTYVIIAPKPDRPPPLPCDTVWLAPPSRWAQARNLVLSLIGFSDLSLQEAVTRSDTVARALREWVETLPELLVMDTIRIGQFFESPIAGTRRVLYMDDLFHLRFRRMLDLAEGQTGATIAAGGTFSALLPPAARRMLHWPALTRWLYRIEMAKVRRRELAAPARFDTCLLINPNEAELLRQIGSAGHVEAIRPCPFTGDIRPRRQYDGNADFVLFGSLRHPLYLASVMKLLEVSSAAMIRAMPELRIRIVGEGASDTLRAQVASLSPHVELLGFVDDIAPLFATACALLVPSISGGGLRLKAVNAMAHGLPIISTTAGVDGIPLMESESYLREDSIEHFAEPMQRLRDPCLNARMSTAAAAVFNANFARGAVFREYDKALSKGGADPKRSPG